MQNGDDPIQGFEIPIADSTNKVALLIFSCHGNECGELCWADDSNPVMPSQLSAQLHNSSRNWKKIVVLCGQCNGRTFTANLSNCTLPKNVCILSGYSGKVSTIKINEKWYNLVIEGFISNLGIKTIGQSLI